MHDIQLIKRKGNDLTLEVNDKDGVKVLAEVTLFDDGNFNARVGSHHVADEVRNDINHFLAGNKVTYEG